MKLVFDTETTGLARFDLPANDPLQPRLVQLGMVLLNDNNDIVGEFGMIVKPEGFEIPTRASDIHGITTEIALRDGVKCETAMLLFADLLKLCDIIIAHNLKFDKIVMINEMCKACKFVNDPTSSYFPLTTYEYCTMLESTSLCNIRKANGTPKWPKLEEAYKHFFNEELKRAHDALTDVRACARIYKHLQEGCPKGAPLNRVNKPLVECKHESATVISSGIIFCNDCKTEITLSANEVV